MPKNNSSEFTNISLKNQKLKYQFIYGFPYLDDFTEELFNKGVRSYGRFRELFEGDIKFQKELSQIDYMTSSGGRGRPGKRLVVNKKFYGYGYEYERWENVVYSSFGRNNTKRNAALNTMELFVKMIKKRQEIDLVEVGEKYLFYQPEEKDNKYDSQVIDYIIKTLLNLKIITASKYMPADSVWEKCG